MFTKTLINRLRWLLWFFLVLFSLALFIQSLWSFYHQEITVEWSTANELGTAGFNVLRAESREGPFIQLNDQIIPSSDSPASGGDYEYRDTDVKAGGTYYYILEDVEFNGKTNQHGPVVQQAENQATIYLILSIVLIIISGIFTWVQLRDVKKASNPKKIITDV